MKTGIPGQLDMFDLLDVGERPAPRRAPSKPTVKQARFVPSPENPVHCVCCGAEITAWFDYDVNHHPMGWHEGQRLCTAMNLTRNHVAYYALQVRGAVTGSRPHCSWATICGHGSNGPATLGASAPNCLINGWAHTWLSRKCCGTRLTPKITQKNSKVSYEARLQALVLDYRQGTHTTRNPVLHPRHTMAVHHNII